MAIVDLSLRRSYHCGVVIASRECSWTTIRPISRPTGWERFLAHQNRVRPPALRGAVAPTEYCRKTSGRHMMSETCNVRVTMASVLSNHVRRTCEMSRPSGILRCVAVNLIVIGLTYQLARGLDAQPEARHAVPAQLTKLMAEKTVPFRPLRRGHGGRVTSVAWSPDGKRLATGSVDETVKIWDAVTGKELLTLNGPGSAVTCVAWSPDGKQLATGANDR